MKKLLSLFLLALSCCTDKDSVCTDSTEFKYDELTGTCKNCSGETGYNEVDLKKIRSSKDAECIYLSKQEMLLLMGDSSEIPNRLSYQRLKNYNFKGSVLDSCLLFFNYIEQADLRGTDLSTLQYGYAIITGVRDEFTIAPLEGDVTVDGDTLRCAR